MLQFSPGAGVVSTEGRHSFAALRYNYRHELVCLGFSFVSQARSSLFEHLSGRRPIMIKTEFGHTVADEILDLLNSRHGCQETPLSSDSVVKYAGWNMLINSMLLDSRLLFLYVPFIASGIFPFKRKNGQKNKILDCIVEAAQVKGILEKGNAVSDFGSRSRNDERVFGAEVR